MKSVHWKRRRTLLHRGGRVAALAWLASLCAAGALAVETPAEARRELVPTGARATIYLDAPDTAEDTVRELRMERGKSVFVRTSYSVRRVSVGDPEILDVVVLRSSELQFVAKDVGTTNVVIWSTSGEIEAAIDLHIGRAYSAIEAEIHRLLGVSDVRIDSAGDAVVLNGSVPDAATLERVLSVARAYFPDKDEDTEIVNLVTVGGNQQVMIEITVSEMNRELRREIGTNFAAHITKDGDTFFDIHNLIDGLTRLEVEDGIETIFFGDQINLIGAAFPIGTGAYSFFVNALHETGLGKILAEPTLVARTGESARFLAGGEVPVPVPQGDFGRITVDYKEFGVGVSFTPTVLSADRIHLDVTTEVSQIDFALGTEFEGIATPGFRTRRVSTGVELGDGQMFAIAGLLRDELVENVNQYPLLGQIPILGTLFRSSDYQKQLTELVLLVRPRLVKTLGEDPPPLPTDYFDEPNWFEFYLLGRAEGFDEQISTAQAETAPEAGFVGDAGYRLPASADDEGGE